MAWQTSKKSLGKPDDLPIQSLPDSAEIGRFEVVGGAAIGVPGWEDPDGKVLEGGADGPPLL